MMQIPVGHVELVGTGLGLPHKWLGPKTPPQVKPVSSPSRAPSHSPTHHSKGHRGVVVPQVSRNWGCPLSPSYLSSAGRCSHASPPGSSGRPSGR